MAASAFCHVEAAGRLTAPISVAQSEVNHRGRRAAGLHDLIDWAPIEARLAPISVGVAEVAHKIAGCIVGVRSKEPA